MLKEKMFVPYDVPVVFIDSVIPDGDADEHEDDDESLMTLMPREQGNFIF